MSKNYTAQLGCGTLILIAIIVALIVGSYTKDLKSDISSLQTVVENLKESVDVQTVEIQALRSEIEALRQSQ